MMKVLVIGLDGNDGKCVHFGTFEAFRRMRISRQQKTRLLHSSRPGLKFKIKLLFLNRGLWDELFISSSLFCQNKNRFLS